MGPPIYTNENILISDMEEDSYNPRKAFREVQTNNWEGVYSNSISSTKYQSSYIILLSLTGSFFLQDHLSHTLTLLLVSLRDHIVAYEYHVYPD